MGASTEITCGNDLEVRRRDVPKGSVCPEKRARERYDVEGTNRWRRVWSGCAAVVAVFDARRFDLNVTDLKTFLDTFASSLLAHNHVK
jgi:hypothetical protein